MEIKTRIDAEALILKDSLHGRVYTDPEIFELEMERVFARSWVYVAHESEIAQPGDYKSTFIGLQPVIVTRGADNNRIYVLYNRCRHRAATVCQQEHGNANAFRCAYHGWTYNNRGDLIGVPYREGYGDHFAYGDHGLTPVARVGNYRGFIFASLSAEGPSLDEHLGNSRQFLDTIANQGDAGINLKAGVHKYRYGANWKLQLENTLDNYHVMFVHESFMALLGRRTGRRINMSNNTQWHSLYLGGGHGAIDFSSTGGVGASTFEDIPFNLVVFPNLAFVGVHVRTIRPISVDETEVSLYPTLLARAPRGLAERWSPLLCGGEGGNL